MKNVQLAPLVSVIIPAYNAEKFIAETIESIIAQTYPNIEVIIVDDGSTDQTSRIVHGYQPRVRYYYQRNSGGSSIPRNTGIAHSLGDYLCFNDADDLMIPDRIATQVDFLERHPDVGLVFSNYRNFNEEGPYPNSHFETCQILHSYLKDQEELIIDNACLYLAQENFGIASSFLMRKRLQLNELFFEPSLKCSEDFHFYYRLSKKTKVGIINKVGMMRRLHGNNMSGDTEKMLPGCIRSYTMLREGENDAQARYYLDKFIACFWSDFSRYNANHGRYLQALRQEVRAFCIDFCLLRLYLLVKNILRTIFMAINIHKPNER